MSYLVIGSGSIGTRHHGNLERLGAEVTLIPWRGLDLDTLDLSGVTGLIIATATQVRADLIARAAEADVPVYVEKPLAFRQSDVAHIRQLAANIADRSVLGLMMRLHPAIRYVHDHPIDAYSVEFAICLDVRQWRANWRFADSYAAKAQGGVLLDLCHELDMTCCFYPDLRLGAVDCVGHAGFPDVDFATRISLAGTRWIGSVAMDYLAPVGFRQITLKGRDEVLEIDLLANTGRRWRNGETEDLA